MVTLPCRSLPSNRILTPLRFVTMIMDTTNITFLESMSTTKFSLDTPTIISYAGPHEPTQPAYHPWSGPRSAGIIQVTFDTQPDERDMDETAEQFASAPEDAISGQREMDGIVFDLMMDGRIRVHGRTGTYYITAIPAQPDTNGAFPAVTREFTKLRCSCLGWRSNRPCRHEKAAVKLALACTKQEEEF